MEEEFDNVDSPEIKKWFEDYQNHLNIEKTQVVFDETKFLEPFVEMERSCSLIDQKILDIESTLRKTLENSNKIASCTSNSQFCATASLSKAKFISTGKTKQDSGEGFFSRIIGIAHSFSNWFFGIIEIY